MKRSDFLQLLGWGVAGLPALSDLSPPATGQPGAPVKPARLKRGDTIGLVSPASRLPDPEQYDEIVTTIKGLGFQIKEGRNARSRYGYLAGSDASRAADLNAMFEDIHVDAIIPFRGGWGSNRILDQVDYDAIMNHPKPIIGFSDITSLLLAIYAKTGLITFHGPVGKSEWTDFTVNHFKTMLMEPRPQFLTMSDDEEIRTITPGETSGPLLGGNLTVLTSMLGSEYLPDFEGAILFLEDVGEDIYRIDRMITQLKLSGILDQIGGFIFGKCTECNPGNHYSLTLDEVFEDHIAPLNIPAFRGAMIGHIDNIFTLPVGLPVKMDADRHQIVISDPPVD